jgi:peptidoglycan/xylan/chitin deacetylase (PgdA/CDA1 family)
VRAITLGFHDVLDVQRVEPGAVYIVRLCDFKKHLQAVEQSAVPISTVSEFRTWGSEVPVFLTFDDGTAGAHAFGSSLLLACGWRAHFFITTDWIGRNTFMNRRHIRELHELGHVIGSHSCSHPERMSILDTHTLIREWADSCAILSDIIGAPVRTASVAGGYYSRRVAETAASAGIQVLFTSEPVSTVAVVDSCLVLGRYSIQSFTPPETAGAIVSGALWPRWKQRLLWDAKRILKTVGGNSYVTARRRLLSLVMSHPRSSRP